MRSICVLCLQGEYFNTTLEKYKVIYPDRSFDHISKYEFDRVQIIVLYIDLLKGKEI